MIHLKTFRDQNAKWKTIFYRKKNNDIWFLFGKVFKDYILKKKRR